MEGRTPTGVLLVMVNNTEPSKDAEFNRWYNDIHLPEVCATGAYYAATRFENADAGPDEARYIAVYETDWDHPEEAFTSMQKQTGNMDIWPHLDAVLVKTFKFTGSHHEAPKQAAAKA